MPIGMPEPNYPTDQLDVLRHEFGFVAFVEYGTKSHGIARRALDEAAKLRNELAAAIARAETAEAAYHRLDSAQAAAGSYAGRAEAAEAALAALRARLAELGAGHEWAIHCQLNGIDYYEGPYDSAEQARESGNFLSPGWRVVKRPVGGWREADATPHADLERAAAEQCEGEGGGDD